MAIFASDSDAPPGLARSTVKHLSLSLIPLLAVLGGVDAVVVMVDKVEPGASSGEPGAAKDVSVKFSDGH